MIFVNDEIIFILFFNEKLLSQHVKNYVLIAGLWKKQFILAQGQVNCQKVLVYRKFYLSYIKEKIMHKDLSQALT